MSSSSSVDDYTWTTEEFDNISLTSFAPRVSMNPFLAPGEVAVIQDTGHKPAVSVHLPPFWPTRPAAWFGAAEAAFSLKRVTEQRDKFSYAIAVLGEDQLIQISDLLEQFPPPPDAWRRLKERLVQTHALDRYQRLELLLDLPPLGGQRPSVMLAEMRQLCAPGEDTSEIFRGLFLRRLPREMRLVLAEDRESPVQAIAARADALVAHAQPGVVAPVPVQLTNDPVVAAATTGGRSQPQKQRKPSRGRGSGRGGGRGGSRDKQEPKIGICYWHWKYGDEAYSCDAPCAMKSGN